MTEKEQRKGTKAIDGSTKAKDTIDIAQLRNQVLRAGRSWLTIATA